jgi:SAM-dependent methyltransferase
MVLPENSTSFIDANEHLIRKAKAEDLAHGARFPLEFIDQFCSNHAAIVEFGSGTGETIRRLRERGYRAFGLEINHDASAVAWDENTAPTFWETDVRHLMQPSDPPYPLYSFIEQQHVLMQGLLPSVLCDRDVRSTLRTADTLMLPRGYLFIAEPIHFAELRLFPFQLPEFYEGPSLVEWQQRWFRRYEVNRKAGLPNGVFAVAKVSLPREEKARLDWLDTVADVQHFVHSEDLERFARHVSFVRLGRYLKRLHFQEVKTSPTIMFSRGGEPLLGVVSVWQKQTARYKYRPFVRGTRVDDEGEQRRQLGFRLDGVESPLEFMDRYVEEANKILPPSVKL